MEEKMLKTTRLLMAAALAVAATASTGALATLRTSVTVDGRDIYATDLFTDVPVGKDRLVARAPDPGKTLTLDAGTLRRVAAATGADWKPTTGFELAEVTRAATHLGAMDIVRMLQPELLSQLGGNDIDVRLDDPGIGINMPSLAAPDVKLQDLRVTSTSGRFSARLRAPADGGVQYVDVTGQAFPIQVVPVLIERKLRGQEITASDLAFQQMPVGRLPDNAISDADQLIGMAARRTINPGQPVVSSAVGLPIVISRGDLVTMRYKLGGLVLSARGKAMDEGGVGDVIQVSNVDSKRVLQAVIAGPQLVEVYSGTNVASN
jgi:flagella basal body P-ring formation protein FlgA